MHGGKLQLLAARSCQIDAAVAQTSWLTDLSRILSPPAVKTKTTIISPKQFSCILTLPKKKEVVNCNLGEHVSRSRPTWDLSPISAHQPWKLSPIGAHQLLLHTMSHSKVSHSRYRWAVDFSEIRRQDTYISQCLNSFHGQILSQNEGRRSGH